MNIIVRTFVASLVLLSPVFAKSPGVIIEGMQKDSERSRFLIQYATQKRVRVEVYPTGKRSKNWEFLVVSTDKNSFYCMQQNKSCMKMPPALTLASQLSNMANSMGAQAKIESYKFTPGKKTLKIAGKTCRTGSVFNKTTASVGGFASVEATVRSSNCYYKPKSVAFEKACRNAANKLFERQPASVKAMHAECSLGFQIANSSTALTKLPVGKPQKTKSSFRATKITETSISNAVFKLPSGFKLTKMMKMRSGASVDEHKPEPAERKAGRAAQEKAMKEAESKVKKLFGF